jgi:serine/threonine protein kinase
MTGDEAIQADLDTILRPGQIVDGKYCVDYLIGEGGMAAVWAGANQRTGKRVALKVILRSFASTPDANELFRREALAASSVNHPNVVNVFDVIDHEGMNCIVMELLDGEPFATYLARKGFLSAGEAVALLLPAMRGVAAANAQGVVHRDLKPQNIFICIGPDGRLLTTKILDFGISVVVERAVDKTTSTAFLTAHGTPAYMSPEHIAASSNIDERADVYGFGVIFFEALTGKLPFVGEPGPELLARILSEPPPSLTLFRPDLQPAMVAIIERAMAKEPEDRFPTLNHFITALEEQFLDRSPLPRSLTPMVGVPLFDAGSGPLRVGDPAPLVHRADPSGEHGLNQTKALYALSPVGEPADVETPRPVPSHTTEVPASRTTLVNLRSPSVFRVLRTPIGRRLVSAAAFVGALALVAWFALPRSWQTVEREDLGSARKASAVIPTTVAPATVPPPKPAIPPPEPPEPAVQDPSLPSATGVVSSVPAEPLPTVRPAARPVAKRRAIRSSRARTRAGRGQPALARDASPRPPSPPTVSPPAARVPRAGRLSADDF